MAGHVAGNGLLLSIVAEEGARGTCADYILQYSRLKKEESRALWMEE